jgi:ATP-dependent DNA helicase RecQ
MGRAGRDGAPSTCLMLYSKKDKGLQAYFITNSEARSEIKSLRWRNLDALVAYSEGGECRHAEILTYYKDEARIGRCGHCDSCDPASNRKIQTPVVEVRVKTRKSKERSEPSVLTMKTKSAKTEIVLNAIQEQRFQALKQWRKAKANELDVPAFVVFSDQTLKHMAVKNPQSLADLQDIYGVGESKLEKFGWDVLAELQQLD